MAWRVKSVARIAARAFAVFVLVSAGRQTCLNAELMRAVQQHDFEDAKRLLASQANPNTTTSRVLFQSAQIGHGTVTMPLAYNINPSDALVIAANNNDTAIAMLLLDHGADPNTPGDYGVTPMQCAIYYGNPALTGALLGHGTHPEPIGPRSVVDSMCLGMMERRRSPSLPIFAHADYTREISLLLGAGANPNSQDQMGRTLLAVAAETGETGTVSFLLARGANPSMANRNGDTPLALARRYRHRDIAALLSQALRR